MMLKQKELDTKDRENRVKRSSNELKRENFWYRLSYILIGTLFGIGGTLLYFTVKGEGPNLAPVAEIQTQ